MFRSAGWCAVVLSLSVATLARADEGMWTFDNFPKAKVKAAYGFEPDDAWLAHVMHASVRLAGGCSGSFVSATGLVATNHHCARTCIQALSTKEQDLAAMGFSAKAQADERRCPDMEVHQLQEIRDVTAAVVKATQGLQGERYHDALKAAQAELERACQTDQQTRCEVVGLYHGGQYRLHRYKRFEDVRLVFAPEDAVAFFGGDPYNFTFPRYDLDVSFVRAYEGGKPAVTTEHFRWSSHEPKEGLLTFVSGNPGNTERLLTWAQLVYQRDVALPEALMSLSELRGVLTEYGRRGAEERRTSQDLLFGVENRFKAVRGRWNALMQGQLVAAKLADERRLRSKVAANPQLRRTTAGAWDAIAKAVERQKQLRKSFFFIEGYGGVRSDLMQIARTLVRGTTELGVPNEKRLEEFRESALPTLLQRLFSQAPVYSQVQTLLLTHYFTKLREELGPAHPFVVQILGPQSPEELAVALVKGTRLADVGVRRKLWQGGTAAVAAAAKSDPLLALAQKIDVQARLVRKEWDTEVDATMLQNTESIAKARFVLEGTQTYPDATFSPRLNYGSIKGYVQGNEMVQPITTFAGSFQLHTGREPFALPKTWLNVERTFDLQTPLNFASNNDIIGGNSGSPVITAEREVIGLVFDGNIQSLGGDYGFDPATNRTVSVASIAILRALGKIYGADRLVKELSP
ncbi:MAG: S46 family peptidase [Deltaproteobacteria bacterium]|nr:S46 family peptidase [Deltaproteobacteria bacterium]